MLNISKFVEVKHTKFPVWFEHKNVCIHCGKEGTLTFVDVRGRESTKEVAAFDHMRCTACNRLYSMRWTPLEDNPDVYRPSAVELNVKKDFMNIFNKDVIKKGEKII